MTCNIVESDPLKVFRLNACASTKTALNQNKLLSYFKSRCVAGQSFMSSEGHCRISDM